MLRTAPKITLGLGVCLVILVTASWLMTPCPVKCNVILIMSDALAGNHLATYGYARDTMPETTAFFEKNGIIFDNATANSTWTLPSFTGMYFSDVATNITYAELDGSRPTLQSALRENGVTIRAAAPSAPIFIYDAITRMYAPGEVVTDASTSPLDLGGKTLAGLAASDKPFFLVIHSLETHDPYAPEPPYNTYFGSSDAYPVVSPTDLQIADRGPISDETADVFRLRYDQELAQADVHLAQFLNSIPPSVLAHTVIIFAGDHGEAFNEHGKVRHGNAPYQEELHIPLMMRVPGISARRVEEPVSLLDMAPTVLSFLHTPVPKGFRGESMLPLLSGESFGQRIIPLVSGYPFYLDPNVRSTAPAPRDLKSVGADGVDRAIIAPEWVGARSGNNVFFMVTDTGEKQWYDIKTDPGETNNLAADKGAVLPENLVQAAEALRTEAKPQ